LSNASGWLGPATRATVAVVLPLLVPACVTAALWVMPGDPAEIICPPATCEGTAELARRFHLDQGGAAFYRWWLGRAAVGDLGVSWRFAQGEPITGLVLASLPYTLTVLGAAGLSLVSSTVATALGWLPRRLDPVWSLIGLMPSVILALLFAAAVTLQFGATSLEGWFAALRVALGAVVLVFSDGALAATVSGARAALDAEARLRYASLAELRGESVLSNILPNALPALFGQLRGRLIGLLSASVVVEVVLGIPGLGDLLWEGTLRQDFGVVLGAAWVFSLVSAGLLMLQAAGEIGLWLHVRWAPVLPDGVA
jgi:peptide/nickel transport system permease protein